MLPLPSVGLAAMAAAAGQPYTPEGLLKPTPEQLAWQQGEIMGLIHFNMGDSPTPAPFLRPEPTEPLSSC